MLLSHGVFKLIIENQNEGGSNGSPDVGEIPFKESLNSFFSHGFLKAIHCSCILDFNVCSFSSRLHHKFSSDGIEGEGNGLRGRDHKLSKEEFFEEAALR